MSLTFTMSGNSSILTADFNPPLYLDDGRQYEIGLCNFESFNLIPNIDENNNYFPFGNGSLTVPTGAYEIEELQQYLQKNLPKGYTITIIPNVTTSTVALSANFPIDFSQSGTFGRLLGFKPRLLNANEFHESDMPVEILQVNAICIDCSIATGSFHNGQPCHIIHQFFPIVPTGYKIVESPQNILYFPVSVKAITSLRVRVIDQNGELVNFRNETITIRLHLRVRDGH